MSEGTKVELVNAFGLLLPHLDERQQRLTLGAAARVLGHGGIRMVAGAAGVAESTVSRGKRELEHAEEPAGRVRAPGAGRKPLREADPGADARVAGSGRAGPARRPGISTAVDGEVHPESGGRADASGPQVRFGHGGRAVEGGRLLFAGTSRTTEGARHPDRDAQFRYINDQVTAYLADGQPVISVDAKKKETLGNGREWHRAGQPVQVRAHDFPEKGAQKAVPYGIYDIGADAGWVSVGCDGDTSAFAVATLRRWWNGEGRRRCPHASRLLVTADAGGSNGYRVRAWKKELADFAYETGLEVTVCHFPPGTSKWNKIEHRLFSQISINWRGRPLTSHEVVVSTIKATTTRSGLSVHAELDPAACPTGVTVPDTVMERLPLTQHEWHGTWNYTLRPEPLAPEPLPPSPGFGRFPAGDKLPMCCDTPASPDSSPLPLTISPSATDPGVPNTRRSSCPGNAPTAAPAPAVDGSPSPTSSSFSFSRSAGPWPRRHSPRRAASARPSGRPHPYPPRSGTRSRSAPSP